MPRESTIVAKIMKAATAAGWYVVKLHGGAFQKAGIPDLLCIRRGKAAFLEVKVPGLGRKSEPTPLQRRRMDEIMAKGEAPCFVVTGVEGAMWALGGAAAWGPEAVRQWRERGVQRGVRAIENAADNARDDAERRCGETCH